MNKEGSKLLSENGYKVIRYNNVNPYEGGGGTSYMITDPSVMDVMEHVPVNFYAPFIGSGTGLFGSRVYK